MDTIATQNESSDLENGCEHEPSSSSQTNPGANGNGKDSSSSSKPNASTVPVKRYSLRSQARALYSKIKLDEDISTHFYDGYQCETNSAELPKKEVPTEHEKMLRCLRLIHLNCLMNMGHLTLVESLHAYFSKYLPQDNQCEVKSMDF